MVSYGQQPTITSTGSYFNLPYGTTTFAESENVNNNSSAPILSQNLSNTNPVALQPVISDNKNSTTYMQSNSQISTSTTNSVESKLNEQNDKVCDRFRTLCFFQEIHKQIHHTSRQRRCLSKTQTVVPRNPQRNCPTSIFYLALTLRFPI